MNNKVEVYWQGQGPYTADRKNLASELTWAKALAKSLGIRPGEPVKSERFWPN